MKGGRAIYIVGPCAAESREQVMETAEELAAFRCQMSDCRFIFRAGVWKPRTNPRTFQGAGAQALEWLTEVKRTYGMEVATEVATPEHVVAALEAGVDYLWIGARTSANPMAVQAIADAINAAQPQLNAAKGCSINAASQQCNAPTALLIKNPVNADADLWLGDIERLEKTGLPVMAVHRGCNHQPCWAMAHQVRLARPEIPMLLDPSHMSGDARKVPALMKKIAELGLDGAMVEVHCDPEHALSDSEQQISPDELNAALRQLNAAKGCSVNAASQQCIAAEPQLNWLRAEIDELDEQLWDTIAARMDVSKRIGEWKKAHGVAPFQPERYQTIVESLKLKVERLGLSPEFAMQIWDMIHEESLKQQ